VTNRAVPDVDFGIYYYGRNYFTGVSVKHLLQNQILVSSTAPGDETSFTRLQRNYYAMGGGMVALTGNLAFMPSVLIKYVRNETVQADFTACFLVMKTMTLGASYRTGNALALIVEVNIAKGFSVGYSYDIWFNALKAYNSGSHEIRIGYDLDLFDKDRMLTPRYF
jgi:type IX secretion system PorP/SprF family membrane protein